MNDFDANEIDKDKSVKGGACGHTNVRSQSNGSVTGKWNNLKENKDTSSTVNVQRERNTRKIKSATDTTNEQQKQQDEYCQRYHLLLLFKSYYIFITNFIRWYVKFDFSLWQNNNNSVCVCDIFVSYFSCL